MEEFDQNTLCINRPLTPYNGGLGASPSQGVWKGGPETTVPILLFFLLLLLFFIFYFKNVFSTSRGTITTVTCTNDGE